MWEENIIVTTADGSALHVGEHALRYIKDTTEKNIGYESSNIEQGDVLVYLSLDGKYASDVCDFFGIVDEHARDEVLVIADLLNRDVKPLVKTDFSSFRGRWELIETIYQRNEIKVFGKNNKITISINGRAYQNELNKCREIACIARNGELVFFTDENKYEPVKSVLDKGSFDGYVDEEAIKGLNFADLSIDDDNVTLYRKTIGISGEQLQIYAFETKEFLKKSIVNLSERYNLLEGKCQKKEMNELQYSGFRLWGSGDKLKNIERLLQKGSITNTTILLLGESGTGKTFIAHGIHNCSRRASKPFIHVNCAAIPEQLMESELFGYEEGAFTGAKKGGKEGLFEMANGGTLFLDEITEIPLPLQGKLLEALQSKTFFRVGGTKKLSADVRLLTATNKNIKLLVEEKKFREDLYYRINVFPVELLPLRERLDSIQVIVGDILPDICDRLEIEPVIVGHQAMDKMRRYEWPGNIRELENVLEKAAILCDGKIIMPEDVVLPKNNDGDHSLKTLKDIREHSEEEAIRKALLMFQGDKSKAAKYLDIGRTSMFEKVKKYGLED